MHSAHWTQSLGLKETRLELRFSPHLVSQRKRKRTETENRFHMKWMLNSLLNLALFFFFFLFYSIFLLRAVKSSNRNFEAFFSPVREKILFWLLFIYSRSNFIWNPTPELRLNPLNFGTACCWLIRNDEKDEKCQKLGRNVIGCLLVLDFKLQIALSLAQLFFSNFVFNRICSNS